MEGSLRDGRVANGDVVCVAKKTSVSVPHFVSNHPLICSPPSAWHFMLSVRFPQKARCVDAHTWVRSFIERLLTGDFKFKIGGVFLCNLSPKIIHGLR